MKGIPLTVAIIYLLEPVSVAAWASSQRLADNTRLHSCSPLFSTPQRKPRRDLQKQRRRKERPGQHVYIEKDGDSIWERGEIRPIVSDYAKEQGQDYWIPQEDLVKYQKIQEAKRLRDPGQISNEKLMTEVLSPYKQNWIGAISVLIVVIVAIIKNFPELLNTPTISFPDL